MDDKQNPNAPTAPAVEELLASKDPEALLNALLLGPSTSQRQTQVSKLLPKVEDERNANFIREIANIGSSMAESMTGARPGNRLGMLTENQDALAALTGKGDSDRSFMQRAALAKYIEGSRDKRQAKNLSAREAALGLKKDKFAQDKSDKAQAETRNLAKDVAQSGAPRLVAKADNFMELLEKVENPSDIPGFGQSQALARSMGAPGRGLANAFTSEEGINIRGAFQDMLNESIKTFAGSAATVGEVQRVLEAYNSNLLQTEDELLAALDRIYDTYEADVRNIMASADKATKKQFKEQGGADLVSQVGKLRKRLAKFKTSRTPQDKKGLGDVAEDTAARIKDALSTASEKDKGALKFLRDNPGHPKAPQIEERLKAKGVL